MPSNDTGKSAGSPSNMGRLPEKLTCAVSMESCPISANILLALCHHPGERQGRL